MKKSHRGWTTIEYCWRLGLRPLMWAVRLGAIAWAAASLTLLADAITPLGMFTLVLIYGIWEVSGLIRSNRPLHINIAKGETLVVENGATISVPKEDIDRLIETIGRQEARSDR